jgi:hypothetical protein
VLHFHPAVPRNLCVFDVVNPSNVNVPIDNCGLGDPAPESFMVITDDVAAYAPSVVWYSVSTKMFPDPKPVMLDAATLNPYPVVVKVPAVYVIVPALKPTNDVNVIVPVVLITTGLANPHALKLGGVNVMFSLHVPVP